MRLSGELPVFSSSILQCEEVMVILRHQREEIRDFHVASLFLFGSVARNEATASSDIVS
ncbi:nucleotidyltransferase domain-containing protein [Cronbergia sp. UHCC 0137]|uniref:nucleotidyltransferase domain-containing protein n=1 Tax=Cronbergia sp. UHCC 0137 TaxID=3110239 RepID=UPI002B212997|nr:nucleotidyltransferase domain-containing protein [Cronbergia sp. UHCC 0137]MEA5620492.1 nucleotidyltransferase domain-containing protein [Cronbergia sp. UHCC 0137]